MAGRINFKELKLLLGSNEKPTQALQLADVLATNIANCWANGISVVAIDTNESGQQSIASRNQLWLENIQRHFGSISLDDKNFSLFCGAHHLDLFNSRDAELSKRLSIPFNLDAKRLELAKGIDVLLPNSRLFVLTLCASEHDGDRCAISSHPEMRFCSGEYYGARLDEHGAFQRDEKITTYAEMFLPDKEKIAQFFGSESTSIKWDDVLQAHYSLVCGLRAEVEEFAKVNGLSPQESEALMLRILDDRKRQIENLCTLEEVTSLASNTVDSRMIMHGNRARLRELCGLPDKDESTWFFTIDSAKDEPVKKLTDAEPGEPEAATSSSLVFNPPSSLQLSTTPSYVAQYVADIHQLKAQISHAEKSRKTEEVARLKKIEEQALKQFDERVSSAIKFSRKKAKAITREDLHLMQLNLVENLQLVYGAFTQLQKNVVERIAYMSEEDMACEVQGHTLLEIVNDHRKEMLEIFDACKQLVLGQEPDDKNATHAYSKYMNCNGPTHRSAKNVSEMLRRKLNFLNPQDIANTNLPPAAKKVFADCFKETLDVFNATEEFAAARCRVADIERKIPDAKKFNDVLQERFGNVVRRVDGSDGVAINLSQDSAQAQSRRRS